MNKYTELSDFDINKKVAEKLSITCEFDMGTVIIYRDSECHTFEPCNNPADAMPIVFENGISLISDWNKIGVWGATYQPWWTSENKNPLRAAMEVFLMMNDEENNND